MTSAICCNQFSQFLWSPRPSLRISEHVCTSGVCRLGHHARGEVSVHFACTCRLSFGPFLVSGITRGGLSSSDFLLGVASRVVQRKRCLGRILRLFLVSEPLREMGPVGQEVPPAFECTRWSQGRLVHVFNRSTLHGHSVICQ